MLVSHSIVNVHWVFLTHFTEKMLHNQSEKISTLDMVIANSDFTYDIIKTSFSIPLQKPYIFIRVLRELSTKDYR